MARMSIMFMIAKYCYVGVLVLAIIFSSVLFAVGLYALNDPEDHSELYLNIMRYFSIDEFAYKSILNETSLNQTFSNNNNTKEDNVKNQNFMAAIMIFVGVISVIIEVIALIAALLHHMTITLAILLVMVFGLGWSVFMLGTVDMLSITTQSIFIVLATFYLVVLKRDAMACSYDRGTGGNIQVDDVEMNRTGPMKRCSADHVSSTGSPLPVNGTVSNGSLNNKN